MRPAGRVREFFGALKDAARQWHGGRTFEMGAALAFYAVFAFAPLLVLAIAVAGLFLGQPAAEGEALHRLHTTLGPTVGGAIEGLLRDEPTGRGSFPTWMCLVVLVIGCMGFFGQLQQSLNAIGRVRPRAGRGVGGVVRDRVWAFLLTLGVGALLLVFLMLRAALAVVDRLFPSLSLPGGVYPWRALDWGVALGFFTVLFALVYKLLPDVRLTWEDVWAGAVLTALLFLLGNGLITLYLRAIEVASAYGAAGSVVVFLLWVFYSSQLFLFGAEFTQALAQRAGRPPEPKPNAEPLPGTAPAADPARRP